MKTQIMIVEDEAIVGLDIRECLEEFGYLVVGPVESGEEAIQTATAKRPSLVLMDIMLKGKIDGIAAAEKIKKELDIPVVFLTAFADGATFSRAKVTEPYGYILKPFKKMEVRTVVELALHRHRMDQQRERVVTSMDKPGKSLSNAKVFDEIEKRGHSPAEIQKIGDFLRQLEPFIKLSPEVRQLVAGCCNFQIFESGQYLVSEGAQDCTPFIVASGRVALVKSSVSGKDLIVDVICPLDPFGLLATLDSKAVKFSVKAQTDSVVLWVPRKIVSYILDNEREASRGFIERILQRLRKSHDLSRALAHDRVEVRVASVFLTLLSASSQNPNYVSTSSEITLSRQELAEMAGTAAETASRVANAMEREGLVDLSQPGKVSILDRKGLLELMDF